MSHFNCIVLGAGGFGSAAFYHLARRGKKVLAIERFGIAHDRGSSHGQTRIIRKAYLEHPDYIPLVLSAYEQWDELASRSSMKLFEPCGLLLSGPEKGETITGTRLVRERYQLNISDLTRDDATRLNPSFRFPPDHRQMFDADAGFLHVERCVEAHLKQGVVAGGELLLETEILEWKSDGTTASVRTSRGDFTADQLIITPGAWAPALLADLNLPLHVLRKPLLWHGMHNAGLRLDQGAPCFYFETAGGVFYGFPSLDGRTIKVAEHSGGEVVDDPISVNRHLHENDVLPMARFLRDCLPDVTPRPQNHAICMYTMTPDHHFIVGPHPRLSNVFLGAGFSGHGFKFTSSLGKALCDLACDGRTDLPIGFLSPQRFSGPER